MLSLPSGVPMPMPYRWVYLHGLRELPPWELIDQARANGLRGEFLREVEAPNPAVVRDWFPFAAHRQGDDFAGFVLVDGVPTGEVAIVHLTWRGSAEQPGWPAIQRLPSFWHWFRHSMIDDAIEWATLNGDDDVWELEHERDEAADK